MSARRLAPQLQRIARATHSVRVRLALWSLGILSVILLGFSAFVYTRQEQDVAATDRQSLVNTMNKIALYYKTNGVLYSTQDGSLILPLDKVPILLGSGEFRIMLGPDNLPISTVGQLIDPRDLARMLNLYQKSGASDLIVSIGLLNTATPGEQPGQLHAGQQYNVAITSFPTLINQKGAILVGQPADAARRMPSLALTLAAASLGTLLVSLVGSYWLAGRIMAPLQTITRAARQIGESDLHRRIGLKNQDELGELANTFDGMLARLEAAFDRQHQFTADASHELRTPLTIIELEAERTLETPSTLEEYQRAMQVVRGENETMMRLVEDLLTLARLDAGRANFRMEPLDLGDLALEVSDRLAGLASSQGVELSAGELPEVTVTGDRPALGRVLTNLVENAIKFSRGATHEPARVSVETGKDGTEWGWVRVSDTGPGIPEDDLPSIFDRFYQADKVRSRSPHTADDPPGLRPGSGLGLSIVQSIIQAHAGEVCVTSVVGQGTVFEVRLRLVG
jgi:signal transduction histidine kinase